MGNQANDMRPAGVTAALVVPGDVPRFQTECYEQDFPMVLAL